MPTRSNPESGALPGGGIHQMDLISILRSAPPTPASCTAAPKAGRTAGLEAAETPFPDPAEQSPWGEGVLGQWSGKTVHAEGCVSSPVCSRTHMSINSTVSHMGPHREILHSSENETFSSSKTRYKAHRQNVELKKPY